MEKTLKIGLFGFGCVGSGLYEVLNRSELLGARIKTIVVKDKNKKRPIPEEHFSFDANEILLDESINVVAELIDDADAAYKIVTQALRSGKHVVSANKKLVAEHLDELIDLARENNVSFLYEAAVAGSIPVLRNLEEYYNNDSLSGIQGIVNGTTNYILTQSNEGISYVDALAKAQELGFAEADPTLDVEGFDAAYKLVILLKHAFGLSTTKSEIPVRGITSISSIDLKYASERNLRIKLLARAELIENEVFAVVAPHFVDETHPTYNVSNEFNAVLVQALFSNQQLFIGKGAGSLPTASAVLSDISALKYDYKYEYRKAQSEKLPSLGQGFSLRVLISADIDVSLEDLSLNSIEERYFGLEGQFLVARIEYKDLQELFSRKDLSVVLFNDEVRSENSLVESLNESNVFA